MLTGEQVAVSVTVGYPQDSSQNKIRDVSAIYLRIRFFYKVTHTRHFVLRAHLWQDSSQNKMFNLFEIVA